jgi:cardiolipin synthase
VRQDGAEAKRIRRTGQADGRAAAGPHAEASGPPWWLLSLAAVGAVAVGGAFITLFSALGRRPDETWATAAPDVGSRDFLLGISGTLNAPLARGGTARLLNNGVEIFPAILREIRAAKKTINFMVYIWEPGHASDQIFDALAERARAGVQVRLVLDGIGAINAPEDRIRELRAAGGKVAWFRTLKFGKLTRYHRRNHRRAIIIDGSVGFTGGAAVADYWLETPGDGHWRDIMVEVRGCIAGNLQSAFAQVWAATCGEILLGPSFFPTDYPDEQRGEHLTYHVNVISSPASDAYPLRMFFWTSFRCARERLFITSPYFIPDAATRKVIADRARAGVDVRMLLPDENIDVPPVRLASHAAYRELLEAGVRIYEYQGAMIHAKVVAVDGKWGIIGSANMDIRSRELNLENVLGVLDDEFARQLEDTFRGDLEHATEITLDDWNARSWWRQAGERFWGLFAEQF